MAQNAVRLIRLNKHTVGAQNALQQQARYALERIAETYLLPEIEKVYKKADGSRYKWEVVSYQRNRRDRWYTVIKCDDLEVRHKEAAKGLIARRVRELTYRTPVLIRQKPDGSFELQ